MKEFFSWVRSVVLVLRIFSGNLSIPASETNGEWYKDDTIATSKNEPLGFKWFSLLMFIFQVGRRFRCGLGVNVGDSLSTSSSLFPILFELVIILLSASYFCLLCINDIVAIFSQLKHICNQHFFGIFSLQYLRSNPGLRVYSIFPK